MLFHVSTQFTQHPPEAEMIFLYLIFSILLVSVILSTVIPLADARGVWGTGTRRSRAAEREFTLPNHMMTDDLPAAKSFEELKSEAEAEIAATKDKFYPDTPFNSLSGGKAAKRSKDTKRKRKTQLHDEVKVNQGEVELFLHSAVDHLVVLLDGPGLIERVEELLTRVLSLHFRGAEADSVRTLLRENRVAEAVVEAKEYLVIMREAIPACAAFVMEFLAPEDVLTLLTTDWSVLTAAGDVSSNSANSDAYNDLLEVAQRLLKKIDFNLDDVSAGASGHGGLADLENLLSTLHQPGGKDTLEDVMNKFASFAKGDTLSSLSGDILARPEHYLDDFRTQLREMPMLADMAGISSSVVNNDKEWGLFVKSLQMNLELLQEGKGGSEGSPEVADIFGVDNPQLADIMRSMTALEKDIDHIKAESAAGGRKNRGTRKSKSKRGREEMDKGKDKKRQSYQSMTAAAM